MATIQFGPLSASKLGFCFFSLSGVLNGTGLNQSSGAAAYLSGNTASGGVNSFIRIMQGSRPTAWSQLSNANTSRSADVLIQFANTSNAILSASTTSAGNFVNINTGLQAATQTGTASWFWMLTANTTTGAILQQLIGTNITTVGGGGDLEIQSTSIVSGTQYSVSNLLIEFPSTYTY